MNYTCNHHLLPVENVAQTNTLSALQHPRFVSPNANIAADTSIIPKTKRKTLYCDREIRDGKTCKQIASYENHNRLAAANNVITEFDRVKGLR